ncbi:MAG: hypothetical protein ACRDK3_09610 [Actinomycetota bacterium]
MPVEVASPVDELAVPSLGDFGALEPPTFVVDSTLLRTDLGALLRSVPESLDPAEAHTAPPMMSTAAATVATSARDNLVEFDKSALLSVAPPPGM